MSKASAHQGHLVSEDRAVMRRRDGSGLDWLFPDEAHHHGHHQPGETYCAECHAVYENKRWSFDVARFRAWRDAGVAAVKQCPGCRAVTERQFRGELTILGPDPAHENDQRRLRLLNVEAEAQDDNPLARIGEVVYGPGRWQVLTTTAHLAERLGRELQKAFGGELQVSKGKPADRAVVTWIQPPATN